MRNQFYAVDISEDPVIHPAGSPPQASQIAQSPKINPDPVILPMKSVEFEKSAQPPTYDDAKKTLENLFVEDAMYTGHSDRSNSIVDTTQDDVFDSIEKSSSSPRSPKTFAKYAGVYSALFLMPILLAVGVVAARDGMFSEFLQRQTASQDLLNPLATTGSVNSATAGATAQDTTTAQLASASTATSYEYELSLAQGFLQKAIRISNASPSQTATEKQEIVEYLNQALLASNRAVALDPNDHRGYTTRARVYMATSVMNPENSSFAQADLDRARALGATSESFTDLGSPLDQLPTQQAADGSPTLVALPEEKPAETEASIGSSSTPGTATVYEGLDAIYIVYPETTATSTINLTILGENHGLQAYVKNKREGSGFTIGLTGQAPEDISISWFVTQE